MIPQLIFIALVMLELGVNLAKDGEDKKQKFSFGRTMFSTIIVVTILYFGGFFNPLLNK